MDLHGVSIVIPVYCNATTLPELCRRIRAVLADRPVEIVLVDDASSDDSLQVMAGLDALVIAHERNQGQNVAILAGLTRASHRLTCVLDADLEDPPEALPLLLEPVESGIASVAFASRDGARRQTSRLFRWTLQRLFPSLPEHACLFFAIDRAGRTALIDVARNDDYLPAVIGALGLSCTQVAVARGTRPVDAGPGAYDALKRLRYAAKALRAALRVKMRPPGH